MLDVHLPERPIDSVREFLLHLFTITVGLLIAVGIEAAVERHLHRELAAEARETLTAEIRKNDTSVKDALATIEKEQEKMQLGTDRLKKIQLNPADPSSESLHFDIAINTTGLEDTAWRTAQATGALAFMSYGDSSKFTGIYREEENFEKKQDQLTEDEARFLGVIRKYHVGDGKFTKEAADAMAEQFGIMEGHLLFLKITARVLEDEQTAFLEGREPKHNMEEKLSH
jgi:hypothetical protein